ncbi:beta-ketoacyl synthase N-terminal-like domain-containing protein [Streptomyces sp. 8N616]|uniref:beta-ketoacyl synthase N-terminal-like domain-containing protein n=1 Tax=Streptomyces sp. 8N616 TaxID=3457414 RepID=UPI003FD4CFDD
MRAPCCTSCGKPWSRPGYAPPGSRAAGAACFVGQATSVHAETNPRAHEPDVRSMVGSRLRAVTAGRISYAPDLRGPSVVLDTACSSSLVAGARRTAESAHRRE